MIDGFFIGFVDDTGNEILMTIDGFFISFVDSEGQEIPCERQKIDAEWIWHNEIENTVIAELPTMVFPVTGPDKTYHISALVVYSAATGGNVIARYDLRQDAYVTNKADIHIESFGLTIKN